MTGEVPERLHLRTLSVLLTGRCNLDCAYCYRGGGSRGTDLADGALDAAMDLVRRLDGPAPEIVFSGGEPALRFDEFRRAAVRLRAAAAPGRRPALRLVTNGTLLDDERVDFLVAQDVGLSLSLDGVEPAQRRRGAAAVAGTDGLLERLRRRHPGYLARRVRAVMTLLPGTVDSLAASVDHLLGSGLRDIRAAPVLTPVPGWDDDPGSVLAAQLAAVRRRCEDELAAVGDVSFRPLRRYGPEPEPADDDRRDGGFCRIATGTGPALDLDGRLYACLMFAPSGLGFGSGQGALHELAPLIDLGRPDEPGLGARAARLPGMLAGRPGFAPRSHLSSRLGDCADCFARASCRVCPYVLLRFQGDGRGTRVPALVCAWQREVARQRALMPALPAPYPEGLSAASLAERRARFRAVFGLPPPDQDDRERPVRQDCGRAGGPARTR